MAPHKTKTDEIIDILVRDGVLTPHEEIALHNAFHESDTDNFEEFLLNEGLVDTSDILNALAEYYEVPSFDVLDYFFERQLLHQFPKQFLLQNAIIPVETEGDTEMVMVAADPNDAELLAKIGKHVSYDIVFRVGIRMDIEDAIKEFYDEAITEVAQDVDINAEQRLSKEEKDIEDFYEDDEWDQDDEE